LISPVFVARDRELRLLLDALGRVQVGEAGVVLLAGEAGIGKTRLVLAKP
jgi:predicted ATPase